MSESYAEDAPRTASSGFLIIALGSVVAVILLILAFTYNASRSGRIAGLYKAVAGPANQALTAEVAAYHRDQRTSLTAAKADLAKLIDTATTFDAGVVAVSFPGNASHAAARLVNADRARIKLFRQQAKATTLRQLRSFNRRDQAANALVAAQAQQTRLALALPAASGQQY